MDVDESKIFNDENNFSIIFKKKLYRKRIEVMDVVEMFNFELNYVERVELREKILIFLNYKVTI